FARKHDRPETRMHQPGKLKERPVMPSEVHRHHRCLHAPDDAADGGAPLRIGNAARGEIEMRYFTGREHREQSPFLHPAYGLLHSPDVRARRFAGAERVHKDEMLAKPRNAMEYGIGKQPDVGTHRGKKSEKGEPFDAAKR